MWKILFPKSQVHTHRVCQCFSHVYFQSSMSLMESYSPILLLLWKLDIPHCELNSEITYYRHMEHKRQNWSMTSLIRRVKKLKFLIFLLSISENMRLTHINQIKTKKIDFGCRIIPIFLVFCRRDIIYHVCISLKTSQWPYHAYFSSKWKNKTTFFSSTLKVG